MTSSAADAPERSPLLMNRSDTLLLIVDMQPRLLTAMTDAARTLWNTSRLAQGAKLLGIPAIATEQVPEKLGSTDASLTPLVSATHPKQSFSCCSLSEVFAVHLAKGRHRVLLTGIEAHVCVQQTALDLLALGFNVYLAMDAMASRFAIDRDVAVRRMEASGVTLTTTEAALMEWTVSAADPQFREISRLLKETSPA